MAGGRPKPAMQVNAGFFDSCVAAAVFGVPAGMMGFTPANEETLQPYVNSPHRPLWTI